MADTSGAAHRFFYLDSGNLTNIQAPTTNGITFRSSDAVAHGTFTSTGWSFPDQIVSTKTIGTAPFSVVSTTPVANLTVQNCSSCAIANVTNSAGLQLFNSTTTCTTGASIGAICTSAAITLPVAYADTNYRLSCTGQTPTNVPIVQTYAKSNTTFTITIAALTAAAARFTSYDCSAVHN